MTDEQWLKFDGDVTETFNDKVTLLSNDPEPVSIDMKPEDVKVEEGGKVYVRKGAYALRINNKTYK